MRADEFVLELQKIPVKEEILKSQGVTEEYVRQLRDSYTLRRKDNPAYQGNNPVLELVGNYETSKLEIGMIVFDDEIEENEDYFFFGRFEVDDLAVNKNLGIVSLLEEGSDEIVFNCASSGSNFLEALSIAASFLEERANNDELYENEEVAKSIAEECSELAGDKDLYLDFYLELLG